MLCNFERLLSKLLFLANAAANSLNSLILSQNNILLHFGLKFENQLFIHFLSDFIFVKNQAKVL
jgi:hypothetical protein